MKITSIFFILFLLTCKHCFSQGIEFSTLESATIQKTSYSVFANESPAFDNILSIRFDLAIHDPSSFGYLFRIHDEAKKQSDIYSLVFSYDNIRQSYLKLNIEAKECRIVDTLQNSTLGVRHWMPVAIKFYLKGDSVVMNLKGKRLVSKNLGLPLSMRPSILFGSSQFSEEVPSFAIKNLYIEDESKAFHFPLNESSGNAVHDTHKKIIGHVINPVWLINKSYNWNLCFSFSSESVAGATYDPDNGKMLLFNNDSLLIMDATRKRSETFTHSPIPMITELGTSFYDPDSRQIYIYEVFNYNNSTTVSTLQTDTRVCTPVSTHFLSSQRHHHSSYYDRKQKQYYIFGGFGSRKYFNELEMYDQKTNQWETVVLTGDTIIPRFFSSMGAISDHEVLLFGGTGNSSGDQSVGKIYYYDLYKINLQTGVVKKLWETTHNGQNVVPVRGLIVSEDKKSFYTLCYPMQLASSHLQLYQFSLHDGTYQVLGDSIPMASKAILSNANLYYNNLTQELYCCVQEFKEHGGQQSKIRIYSLAIPAIPASTLSFYSYNQQITGWMMKGGLAILLLLICGSSTFIILRKRMRRNRQPVIQAVNIKESIEVPPTPTSEEVRINALFLFGEFAVKDSKGKDITYMFSNKIKQLFLLTLLKSFNTSKGITATSIYGALWPDKDMQSAKNLKCVSINKIRKILEELEGISFIYEDKHYKIEMAETFYCDYQDYLRLINRLTADSCHTETLKQLSAILNRGRFLGSTDDLVFDKIKAAQEEEILNLLPFELERLYSEQGFEIIVSITNAIFLIDPYNDTALWYLLNTLHKTKREDAAMRKYYLFTSDYLKHMGANYPYSYTDITHYSIKELIKE